jgi:hypothetical protein
MCLRDVLNQIVAENQPVILRDSRRDWVAADLLENLSASMLKRAVHMLPGVYIAAVTEAGLMGEVLYRLRPKA